MMRSDLLLKEVIKTRIEELNQAKDYLICAAHGDIEKNDSSALDHLQALVYMTIDLKDLLENLPFITVDIDRLSNS